MNQDVSKLPKWAQDRIKSSEKLVGLLRHAIQRNHEHSPKSCTPCEEIENLLGLK